MKKWLVVLTMVILGLSVFIGCAMNLKDSILETTYSVESQKEFFSFNKIEIGMTTDEVITIIGPPTKIINEYPFDRPSKYPDAKYSTYIYSRHYQAFMDGTPVIKEGPQRSIWGPITTAIFKKTGIVVFKDNRVCRYKVLDKSLKQ